MGAKSTHVIEKQLLSGLPDLGLRVLALPPAGDDGAPLERGRAAVEDEHGLGPEEQELADAAEEAEQVRVADHLPSLVPHRLHELHHPDTSICKQQRKRKIRPRTPRRAKSDPGERGMGRRKDAPTASLLPARVSTETRRPTGARSSQRPWTPISVLCLRFFDLFSFYTVVDDEEDDGEEDVRSGRSRRAARAFGGLRPGPSGEVGRARCCLRTCPPYPRNEIGLGLFE